MQKVSSVVPVIFIVMLLSSGEARAAQAKSFSVILNKREERLLVRLTRRQKISMKRDEMKQERLLLRTKNTSTHVKSRSNTSPALSSQESLLPNQSFKPTLPLPSLDASSHFLMLGETNPVIATIKVNPRNEPVNIRSITVTLSDASTSLTGIEVIDDLGFVLGIATLDLSASSARDVYTLSLSPKRAYYIAMDDEVVLAARAHTQSKRSGGISGEEIGVSSMTVSATGRWSSKSSDVVTIGTEYRTHETTLAEITAISRNGSAGGVLTSGVNRRIAAFDFEAKRNSDGAPALESIMFSTSFPSGISLSSIFLRGNNTDIEHPCSIAGSVITCSSIPANIGALESKRTLSLFADITIAGNILRPFLQVDINLPGRPGSSGDITWTDGETSFSWVPFDTPVAHGTSWE